jgi:hypothetical protein
MPCYHIIDRKLDPAKSGRIEFVPYYSLCVKVPIVDTKVDLDVNRLPGFRGFPKTDPLRGFIVPKPNPREEIYVFLATLLRIIAAKLAAEEHSMYELTGFLWSCMILLNY